MFYRVKLFIAIVFGILCSVQSDVISCEPKNPEYPSARHTIDRYSLYLDEYGWTKAIPYKSKLVYEDLPLGELDISMNMTQVHVYSHVLSLYETGTLMLPMKIDHTMMVNFYTGHSFTIHVLDTASKTYKRVGLGYHSKQYFYVAKPNTWVFMEFEKHLGEKIAFIGGTVLRRRINDTAINFAGVPDLLRDFPEHRELILKSTGHFT